MQILLIAFALAMDSVALAMANGAKCQNINIKQILKLAFTFGAFQAIMPFLGYILGLSFISFIASIDHFIAFFILIFLGIKMIHEAYESKDDNCVLNLSNKELILGAIATSIDALAVGITFGFADIKIVNACVIIGVTCFILCFIACYIGKIVGEILEHKALVLGGLILVFIGFKILIEHLNA
ncbi:manganese efflux pump [Campylobacter sp. faydin G-24]|uniref:Putative manganese efflux pump MntP n=1 Tax=Campylobacter anatolicus TaxID=2829105 RepID=A0ABS5HLE9_9BACT|nr:manganese efflux pump MntP family protein [Campylobacter anatolicus]MBR8461320.1 manganese efflux pump [Campylobacter anatolicus]MBR8464497.1 manganese efflux pump [Campylobacter anatolicus]MBR8466290.1 manganese efflux pump [Campylobacter anatolicus]